MRIVRKHNLVEAIVEAHGFISAGVAGATLDVLIRVLRDAVKAGSTIDLTPFGRFRVKKGRPRQGFNPSTLQRITIPEKYRVRFIPDPTLETPTIA